MEKLSFWTTGEDFTHLVRDLWASDLPYNALKCLHGLDISTRLEIVQGTKKLIGDSRQGSLEVVNDNCGGRSVGEMKRVLEWSLVCKLAYNKFNGIYQVVHNLSYLYKNVYDSSLIREASRLDRLVREQIEKDITAQQKEILKIREAEGLRIKVQSIISSELSEPEWDDAVLFRQISENNPMVGQMIQTTGNNIRSFSLDHKLFQDKMEQDRKEIRPENSKETKWNSGYITPSGQFYGCADRSHTSFAENLFDENIAPKPEGSSDNYERLLEKLGWVKLSSGAIHYEKKPTIHQWKAILRWMSNPMNEKTIQKNRIYVNQGYMSRKQIEDKIP